MSVLGDQYRNHSPTTIKFGLLPPAIALGPLPLSLYTGVYHKLTHTGTSRCSSERVETEALVNLACFQLAWVHREHKSIIPP